MIVRRGRGKFTGALPDGLGDLAEHNLITFKSHREALDDWAGVENLEERLDPSGDCIDPKVLEVLREKTAG